MNYLSIDLWTKRCWIAYTVEGIIFTTPWVPRFNLINNLKKIILEKKIDVIIVWMPYDLYWIDKKQLEKTKNFVNKLKQIFKQIKIDIEDERFTTYESINILNKYEKKENILDKKDSLSAFLILESYLNKIET